MEEHPWDWSDNMDADGFNTFSVGSMTMAGGHGNYHNGAVPWEGMLMPSPGTQADGGATPPFSPVAPVPVGQEGPATPSSGDPNLDINTDGAPLRYRTISNIYDQIAEIVEGQELLLAAGEELATFEEVMRHASWKKAMLDELTSIEQNQTWTLVSLPAGHKAIGLKWIFKLKKDEKGEPIKHKARLVAKGYVQKQGVDFSEVFAR
jgi:hypothetical protein